ncbi:MAG: archaetidylserine decarboxylase [Pseudomonadota bacterium]
MKPFFPFIQPYLPQHLISRAVGLAANSRWRPLKNLLIQRVMRHYSIELDDYEIDNPESFESFNAFFTRALKPDARPIDERAHGFACPVDGAISQLGAINDDVMLQAKGKYYSAAALIGDETRAERYRTGQFATLYLAPNNYHRIHMPIAGTLRAMTYVPGRLFSVNAQTAEHIDRVFARNERVIAHFDSPHGPYAMVLVGALNVGSIETVHHGVVAPSALNRITHWDYPKETRHSFDKGDEFGRFNLGSTVILLAAPGMLEWHPALHAGNAVRMGMPLADLLESTH